MVYIVVAILNLLFFLLRVYEELIQYLYPLWITHKQFSQYHLLTSITNQDISIISQYPMLTLNACYEQILIRSFLFMV